MRSFVVAFFVAIFSTLAIAQEVRAYRCRYNLINLLNKYESKTDEALEIFEFRHNINTQEVFKDKSLKMSKVPLLREIFGIYRRDPIAKATRGLFSEVRLIGDVPAQDFIKILKPNTYYTYVIDDEKIVFAQTRPGKVRDFGSKHAILRDQSKDLRMAGEFWVDSDGKFHFDGSSGTFMPPNEQTALATVFFKEKMKISNAQAHLFDPATFKSPGAYPDRPLVSPMLIKSSPLFSAKRQGLLTIYAAEKFRRTGEISMVNESGENKRFYIEKIATQQSEEIIYDTKDFVLTRKKLELRGGIPLNPNSHTVQLARAQGLKLVSQAASTTTTKNFRVYPIVDGKIDRSNIVLIMQLDETNVIGLAPGIEGSKMTKILATFEGDPHLVDQFSKSSELRSLNLKTPHLEELTRLR